MSQKALSWREPCSSSQQAAREAAAPGWPVDPAAQGRGKGAMRTPKRSAFRGGERVLEIKHFCLDVKCVKPASWKGGSKVCRREELTGASKAIGRSNEFWAEYSLHQR
jgi:hypothetical protein